MTKKNWVVVVVAPDDPTRSSATFGLYTKKVAEDLADDLNARFEKDEEDERRKAYADSIPVWSPDALRRGFRAKNTRKAKK